jgi:hypothetical protein
MLNNPPLSLILDTFRIDGKPIPNIDAKTIILKYRDDEGWGSRKTKSVWFSTSELRQLIIIVENLIGEYGKGNGVSIYFGKYPPDSELSVPTHKPNYEGRQTLVFVPTIPAYEGNPDSHKDYFDVATADAGRPNDGSYNHGELNP